MRMPSFDFSGKVAVVTGATKGLGYGMALMLANHGADIVVSSRTAADCEKVAAEIASLGRKALACPADVSQKNQVDNLVKAAVDQFGKIDILANNAGVGITKLALEVSEKEWDRVLDIDLKGVWLMAQAVGRVMVEQQRGAIINIASLGGVIASSRLVPYMTAKAGVIHMTKGLAVEWAKYNVRVNGVAPGYVLTPMTEEVVNNEKTYQTLTGLVPMKRLGTVEEIANVVTFLASDAASFITGETIIVDGGRHAL